MRKLKQKLLGLSNKMDKERLKREFGEKWIIKFVQEDGDPSGGMANSFEGVAKLVQTVREINGTNIVIEDHTPWNCSYDEEY
jgi:hypothetical protein